MIINDIDVKNSSNYTDDDDDDDDDPDNPPKMMQYGFLLICELEVCPRIGMYNQKFHMSRGYEASVS